MQVLELLPWTDWVAVAAFFGSWFGYAWFAQHRGMRRASLLASTNRYRGYWMLQTTYRDPRMLDAIILQNLTHTPSFFSSTTIIIIGGLFALLGTTDKAAELVREIPFAVRTSVLVFDLKVLVLVGIFVYAFFRFSWSMRQYTFAALVIGAMPNAKEFDTAHIDREPHARRASEMLGLAAETFNGGLRAYYFSFAAIGWFFSPVAFMLATLMVILILYRREFRSDVLEVLREQEPQPAPLPASVPAPLAAPEAQTPPR